MEMKRGTAAIMLMLSLEALVVGHLSAAVSDHGVDTIRLPSQGPRLAGHEATAAVAKTVADGEEDPIPCCNLSRCTRSFPPTCSCMDEVKQCAKTCKKCEKAVGSSDASSSYVCRDTYAKPGPPCTKAVAGDIHGVKVETSSEKSVADGEEDPIPCCNLSRCTRSFPPTCSCVDEMKQCAKTCKKCEKVVGSSDDASSSYVCRDTYAKPGPPCTKAVAGDVHSVKAEEVREKTVSDGEEDPIPCCNLSRCTRSFPPTCSCMDEVKTCAKTCKKCEKAVGSSDASSTYVCRDTYAKPWPPCTKTVAGDVHRGNSK